MIIECIRRTELIIVFYVSIIRKSLETLRHGTAISGAEKNARSSKMHWKRTVSKVEQKVGQVYWPRREIFRGD